MEEPPADDEPPAVEDPEPAGAISMDALDPGATEEWALPEDERSGEDIEIEVAAARVMPEPGEDDPEHLQSASGAIEEPLVMQRPPRRPVAPIASVAPPPPPKEPRTSTALPRLPAERPTAPGRSAFAPAIAVFVIASIGAIAASGLLGGNDPTPQLDTGIAPPRAVNAIPEGEAKTVINDLREAAAQARRQRLADQRQTIAAAPAPAEDVEPAPPEQPEPEAPREEPAPAAPAPEDETGEAPADERAPEPDTAVPEGEAEGAIPGETP